MPAISITPKALDSIIERGTANYQGGYVLVLTDLHCLGGTVLPQVEGIERVWGNPHFSEFFPKGYNGYPFAIYVDCQMLEEGYLPEEMLVDCKPAPNGEKLVFKNPKFEHPAE